MKPTTSLALLEKLLAAEDYRQFLRAYFSESISDGPRVSFAAFARRAGFSARSYPREVMNGKRKLTAKSLPKFVRALKLEPDAARYFTYLVYKLHPEEMTNLSEQTKIEMNLKKYREKVRRLASPRSIEASVSIYRESDWPIIYASLGTEEAGSSLAEISSRSGRSPEVCQRILESMLKQDLVEFGPEAGRYHSKQRHLFFQKLGGNDAFKSFYKKSLRASEKDANRNFQNSDRAFFSSVISIDKSRLPEFKTQLVALLTQFVDEAENPDGDGLARMTCAFSPDV